MIIDCHAHVSAPAKLWAYKATILAHRGAHGRGGSHISDDELREAANVPETWEHGHLDYMDIVHTDMQMISPRPFQMMQSEKPSFLVHWFTEEVNNIIHRQCQLHPDKWIGVCGLPQTAGDPIEEALPELERCINELGFKGCLLNPDPYENSGAEAPPLGDRYWYPLYEKLCELDVPAHIHGTGSKSLRTNYSIHFINEESIAVLGLVHSNVFKDFPDLKIIISHGGGAIPYQLGRFMAPTLRGGQTPLTELLRNLYFDTVLYTESAIKMLIETVGADRCLFGAECPGVGSTNNPATNRPLDDIAPFIQNFDWLNQEEKDMILFGNAKKVFKLDL